MPPFRLLVFLTVLVSASAVKLATIEWGSNNNPSHNSRITRKQNPLFEALEEQLVRIPNSHILLPKQVERPPSISIDGMQHYSSYGVYFGLDFKALPHVDHQCQLCDGSFIAVMVPKYLDPMMAKVCFSQQGKCEDAFHKGYYIVDVCQEHYTSPGFVERIQINMYFTNSTSCQPKNMLDEFDCEARLFKTENPNLRLCTTENPYLLASIHQRDQFWDIL